MEAEPSGWVAEEEALGRSPGGREVAVERDCHKDILGHGNSSGSGPEMEPTGCVPEAVSREWVCWRPHSSGPQPDPGGLHREGDSWKNALLLGIWVKWGLAVVVRVHTQCSGIDSAQELLTPVLRGPCSSGNQTQASVIQSMY